MADFTRTFDGKRYYYFNDYALKKDARNRANGMRRRGYAVRITPRKGGYNLWTRPKHRGDWA